MRAGQGAHNQHHAHIAVGGWSAALHPPHKPPAHKQPRTKHTQAQLTAPMLICARCLTRSRPTQRSQSSRWLVSTPAKTRKPLHNNNTPTTTTNRVQHRVDWCACRCPACQHNADAFQNNVFAQLTKHHLRPFSTTTPPSTKQSTTLTTICSALPDAS